MKHYHDYVEVQKTADGVLEVCRECKHKLHTRVDSKGRSDRKYLEAHVRDTAQPNGPTGKIFTRYYGKGKK